MNQVDVGSFGDCILFLNRPPPQLFSACVNHLIGGADVISSRYLPSYNWKSPFDGVTTGVRVKLDFPNMIQLNVALGMCGIQSTIDWVPSGWFLLSKCNVRLILSLSLSLRILKY